LKKSLVSRIGTSWMTSMQRKGENFDVRLGNNIRQRLTLATVTTHDTSMLRAKALLTNFAVDST